MTPSAPTTRASLSRYGATTNDEPDSENSLFSEPMKMRTPEPDFRQVEQLDHAVLRFQVLEQVLQQLDIGLRSHILQQIGSAAHDQPRRQPAFGAGPDRKSLFDKLPGQRIERGTRFLLDPLDVATRLCQRASANMRVEEVRRFLKLRRGYARRQLDHPVLDVAVLRHQHRQRPLPARAG